MVKSRSRTLPTVLGPRPRAHPRPSIPRHVDVEVVPSQGLALGPGPRLGLTLHPSPSAPRQVDQGVDLGTSVTRCAVVRMVLRQSLGGRVSHTISSASVPLVSVTSVVEQTPSQVRPQRCVLVRQVSSRSQFRRAPSLTGTSAHALVVAVLLVVGRTRLLEMGVSGAGTGQGLLLLVSGGRRR